MSDPAATRPGWLLPVLLAVAISTAAWFAFLYATRPNAGELGEIRIVYGDDTSKSPNAVHIVVAEAPLIQKGTVTPGTSFTGVVYYPMPYLTKPNLRLNCGKRQYIVTAETESGFTWMARPQPEDYREDAKAKRAGDIEGLLLESIQSAVTFDRLKPGIVFEDFCWEAKGPRGPLSTSVPKPLEQKGNFYTVPGQESVVYFPIPYDSTPSVEINSGYRSTTIVTECTPTHFKWRNTAKESSSNSNGDVGWISKGVYTTKEPK